MPDRTKEPKELVELAAQQGTYAAKNIAAAASEAVGDIFPPDTQGVAFAIRVSNTTFYVAAASATVIAATAVATRIKRERDLKSKAKKNANKPDAVVEKPIYHSTSKPAE